MIIKIIHIGKFIKVQGASHVTRCHLQFLR